MTVRWMRGSVIRIPPKKNGGMPPLLPTARRRRHTFPAGGTQAGLWAGGNMFAGLDERLDVFGGMF